MLDRPAAGLSVNILQRVAIGRSAIMEPAIFLLDEPLSNVDAAFYGDADRASGCNAASSRPWFM